MIRRLVPWLVVLGVAAMLAAWSAARFYPPLPNPLTLEVEIPRGERGRAEPLVASGRAGAADFLFVRWIEADTVVFGYDSWGSGGPLSPPVKVGDGARHRVEIRMPGLNHLFSRLRFETDRHLRVVVDGATVLDADVRHYPRDPRAIWLGENPIGGSSCEARFSGRIFHHGAACRGGPDQFFSWEERFAAWRSHAAWQVVALFVLATAIFRFWPTDPAGTARRLMAAAGAAIVHHRWFAGTAIVCTVAFGWVITGGTFRFNFPEGFGDFYDFQASSLLQGRLDVPQEGIGDEAFVYAGKYYGYFGVTPALLRLPFVIFDTGFGNLSRSLMLLEYIGCLVATYLVLLAATEQMRGAGSRPSRWTVLLLTVNVGLGSTIFFLGSRAYIYHEAILCGVALALFACWGALKHLANPAGRWWIGSLACGVLSVHARPPAGLFALTLLGCVAVALAWRERRIRRHLVVAALAGLGVLSFNVLSYLKFHSFEGAPLRLNVQYGPERLARIDGKNFHLSNLRFNTYTYLVRPNLLLDRHFPWVSLGLSKPRRDFPEAKSDFADRTLAIPYAMPALFVLATAGGVLAWRLSPRSRDALCVSWLAVVPVAFFMLTAVATVHRYTADFCPFLVTAAAFGFVALECVPSLPRAGAGLAVTAATLWAVFLTVALTLQYQGKIVWGVPDDVRENYRRLGERIDHFIGA